MLLARSFSFSGMKQQQMTEKQQEHKERVNDYRLILNCCSACLMTLSTPADLITRKISKKRQEQLTEKQQKQKEKAEEPLYKWIGSMSVEEKE